MYALLILLYVMQANAIMVPMWCFVLTWVLAVIKTICSFITSVYKLSKEGGANNVSKSN